MNSPPRGQKWRVEWYVHSGPHFPLTVWSSWALSYKLLNKFSLSGWILIWLPSKLPDWSGKTQSGMVFWWRRKQTLAAVSFFYRVRLPARFSQAENNECLPCVHYRCALSHSVQVKQKLTSPLTYHPSGLHDTMNSSTTVCENVPVSAVLRSQQQIISKQQKSTYFCSPPWTFFTSEHINKYTDNHDTFSNHTQIDSYCCFEVATQDLYHTCQPIMKRSFEDTCTNVHANA